MAQASGLAKLKIQHKRTSEMVEKQYYRVNQMTYRMRTGATDLHNVWFNVYLGIKDYWGLGTEAECSLSMDGEPLDANQYVVYHRDTTGFYFDTLPAGARLVLSIRWRDTQVIPRFAAIHLKSDEGETLKPWPGYRSFRKKRGTLVSLAVEAEQNCRFR